MSVIELAWGGDDAFTHMLVVGPTRCGKTATILKPLIYQILEARNSGQSVGLSVIEPKGDIVALVKEICEETGMKGHYLDPLNPGNDCLNVMHGDIDNVAEATVAVLKGLFGKQEAFFAIVQELSARNVTKLLKELYGNDMDLMDVLDTLRDRERLKREVRNLKNKQGNTDLVAFFENELLGNSKMGEKYQSLVIGLRAQLENVTSNRYLQPLITRKSTIDLDQHMEEGGILAVNTALGLLGKAGDAFGQFITMHLQLATFRRPGTERTRVPHYLIIDEYSRYINPDVERFLSIAAEYRVAGIFALQSLGQIEMESGQLSAKAVKRAIMASCRNKICFGGVEAEDAMEFSKAFGKYKEIQREETYEGGLLPKFMPKSYKDVEKEKNRFDYTYLMDGMPRFHFVHRLLQDGVTQPPGIAKGAFIPRNWKEQLSGQARSSQKSVINHLLRPIVDIISKRKDKKSKHTLEKVLESNPFETINDSQSQSLDKESLVNKSVNVLPFQLIIPDEMKTTDKPNQSEVVSTFQKKEERIPSQEQETQFVEADGISHTTEQPTQKETVEETQNQIQGELPQKEKINIQEHQTSNTELSIDKNRVSKIESDNDEYVQPVEPFGKNPFDDEFITVSGDGSDEDSFWE